MGDYRLENGDLGESFLLFLFLYLCIESIATGGEEWVISERDEERAEAHGL